MTRRIGSRYTVSRVIGRGTCGTVWSGQGPAGPVAIKLLREDLTADQTLIARFVQERTVLTSLRHPRIVCVRDLVVDGTDLALVMDLMPGPDLRGRLERDGALPPAEAVAVCADIAEALAAAHERGIVHRDVKPENVLLDAAGRACLTDFGIARLVDGPRRSRATRIVGTPDYLAPEVIEGCPPGPAVDVYALATVLFELTTGWTPFGGGHPGAVLRRHVTEPAPRVPGMPEPLAELLERCLAKAPAARLSAGEFAAALREREPALRGQGALQVTSPRGDQAYDSSVMTHAGTVPLVHSDADPLADDTRSTHVNMMQAIKEPLDPEDELAPDAGERHRGRWILAAVGAGLILLSLLGYLLSQGNGKASGAGDAADAHTVGASSAAADPSATATGLTALPASGDFGFSSYSNLPAPSSRIVGAVQLTYADGFLYAAATGADGNVRVAAVSARRGASVDWTIVPGVSSNVQPALVGAADGRLELYVTSTDGLAQRAVLSAPGGGWSQWTPLGAAHVAGAPAAAAVGAHTVVFAASTGGGLLQSAIGANGVFSGWHALPQAGSILPQVAVAAQGTSVAVYVVRASDDATLRVYDNGNGWQYAWPTGATGQPATAYAADGHPDLFVLSPSAGLQVFQFSGADLHGTMTWVPAGVTAIDPPGVTAMPGGGVALAAVGQDGSVGVYTTTR